MKMVKLALILPCFNEEEILKNSFEILSEYLKELISLNLISSESFICLVDDGSNDLTWKIINEISLNHNNVLGVKLSSNFGHQNALLAGLSECKESAEVFITIDADLQDDYHAIMKMVLSYSKGHDIVYGVRSSRKTDSYFKRTSAAIFYNFQKLLGLKIIKNHADFRLISKEVLINLEKYNEVNIFLRAIIPQIGFKSDIVYYDRKFRIAGETKYPFLKMVSFAWDGITSFSVFPLRLITFFGFIIFIFSFSFSLYFLVLKLLDVELVLGWTSIVLPIYMLGGIQLFFMGIIGEYIGKIYKESKKRPRYIIEKTTK